jgi:O-antigen ligase
MKHSDKSYPYGYVPPHFHNIFIELLVRFGLIGFTLVFAILWLVYRNLWRLYRAGKVPMDWYYFLMAVLAFSLIWGLWDIRIVRWDYRDYTLLFFGMVLAMMPGFAGPRFFERLRPPGG